MVVEAVEVAEPEEPVTMARLMEEVHSLNSLAAILATLLCIIVVFLCLILAYLYFKRQDKRLFKSNKKTIQALNSKLLNTDERTYGSNNDAFENDEEDVFDKGKHEMKKEGKSKFYNVESQVDAQDGKSKFYRQAGLDIKTPSPVDEGEGSFHDIFSGTKSDDDDEVHTPDN